MPPADDRLTQVLVRWEELRQRGHSVSAEELCRDCPDLLPAVRGRISALESIGRLLHTAALAAETAARATGGTGPNDFGRLSPGAEPVRGYTLVERIGKGGFGEVWKARGPSGFHVALKFVPYAGSGGNAEIRSLTIIKDLRHPNLVSVFGAWQKGNLIIIAMELADRTVWDRYREAVASGLPGVPRDELLEYMAQAALAIDYLNAPRHRLGGKEDAGIQHRDIKPQNLLLFGGGVKVADFGLVRLVRGGEASHTGSLTVLYAPPEFFEGRTTRWSDQYSLAVTYCLLRGGRPPFAGESAQIMAGHLSRLPDLTMLPEEERPAVARALAKAPRQGWPTCRAFVNLLLLAVHGRATPASPKAAFLVSQTTGTRPVAIPVGPPAVPEPGGGVSGGPAGRPRRRTRWLLLGSLALLGILTFSLGLRTSRWSRVGQVLSPQMGPTSGGEGPGVGSGKGGSTRLVTGNSEKRAKRPLRWTLIFNTRDGEDYKKQLQAFGAILAVPDPRNPTKYLVIRDLDWPEPKAEDLTRIERIWWIDDKPQSVQSLAGALNLQPPPHFVVYFPERVERDLLEKELTYCGRKESEITETRFEVRRGPGGKYEAFVLTQR
jgi:serine/threonine protein kinase